MIKLLRISFAFFLLIFALDVIAQDDTRISATWQVQKYDIAVALPQSDTDRNVTIKAKIDLKNVSARPASTLTLRINSAAEITAVTINGSSAEFTKAVEKINSSTNLQRIVVRVAATAPAGNLSAVLDYKLSVKENSGLGAVSSNGAQFLPMSFWYPTPNSWYFARGADYAPFRISIADARHTVISSGKAESATVFEQKFGGQPFFVSGSWEKAAVDGIDVYYPGGAGNEAQIRAAELAALASEAKTFTAKLLGTAPDAPLRIIGVKRGGGFSSGGTIFIDDGVFRRGKVDSQTAMTVADSVAKIWIGNAIAVSGDGYGVIREGLTKYIATQFLESKYGKDVADAERLRQRTAYAAVAKRDSPLTIVSPLDDYYYPEVANKGAMAWRLLDKKVGSDQLFTSIRANMQDGNLTLGELRTAFAANKEFLDYVFDQITEMNLQAGLPQGTGGEAKIALRNTGAVDVTVDVEATTANGEKLTAPTTIQAKSYGEVIFKTADKIIRIEIDTEKLYPQTDYSDDIAPREMTDSDMLLAVKRSFDKQEFAAAETTARVVLREVPRFDDVRILFARTLLAQGKTADAEREFKAVLDEKLPTSRSIAWANVGLADLSTRSGQTAQALKYAEAAIQADAEYGASLAARALRNKANNNVAADEGVKAYFAQFDKAAVSNRKAELEAMALSGEVSKFISGISGQTVEWKTQVLRVDMLDGNTALAETSLNIKLLNSEPSSGTAVFHLAKVAGGWKLSSVDIFEVR